MRAQTIGLVGLIVLSSILTYLLIDRAMVADDLATSVDHHQRRERVLSGLVLELGCEEGIDQVRRRVERRWPNAIIKQSGSTLDVDEVRLVFQGDKIVKVE